MYFNCGNRNGAVNLKVLLGITLVLLMVAVVGGGYFYWISWDRQNQLTAMEQEKLQLTSERENLSGLVNEITGTITEIGAKLREVRDRRVQITSLMPLAESDTTVKAEIMDNIAALESQLVSDRQSLDDLEVRMQKSGLRIKALERMVADLKQEIEVNRQTIAELNTTVAQQKTVIEETQVSLAESREVLKSTEAKLEHTKDVLEDTRNTAWYVSGKAKELQAKKVIDRFGLFSKKNTLTGEFDRQNFSKIDITKVSEFTFDCQPNDIQLVPPREVGTYKLEQPEKGRTVLSVVDRDKFWTVPYLVVVAD